MSQSNDLTNGSLARHFYNLAVPAAIGMVFTTLYNVVDVFFAGLIGTDAQAGMAISFQAFFLFVTLGFGLSSALSALVGNAIGAKNDDQASIIAIQGVGFGLLISFVFMIVAYGIGPLLINLITEEGGYRTAGLDYFNLINIGLISFIMAFGLNGCLQAMGDTSSMKQAQIGAFFLNLGLNPLLVFGIPGFIEGIGINGIAISTVISQTGVMIYVGRQLFLTKLFKNKPIIKLIIPDLKVYHSIVSQMLPTTFTMIVMFTAGFVVQYYLKNFGASAVAAYGVALRVEQLFLLPIFGLTGALLPIAAQNFGAEKHDRVREAFFICWKYGWFFMAFACPILYFASPLLMRSFTDDPKVIEIGVSYLRIDGFILPIYMMLFAINSLLQALKKPIWTLVIGIYRQAFGVAFFSWVYVAFFDLGVLGVWFGIATSVLTGFIISIIVTQHASASSIGVLFGKKTLQQSTTITTDKSTS